MTEVSLPEESRVRRLWTAVGCGGRRAYRYGRRFAVTIGVIVAVVVVSVLTIDLGPARGRGRKPKAASGSIAR
jgi:hypothetical protein